MKVITILFLLLLVSCETIDYCRGAYDEQACYERQAERQQAAMQAIYNSSLYQPNYGVQQPAQTQVRCISYYVGNYLYTDCK